VIELRRSILPSVARARSANVSGVGGLIIAGLTTLAVVAALRTGIHLSLLTTLVLATAMLAAAVAVRRPRRRQELALASSAFAERMRLSHGRSHISCFTSAGDKRTVVLPGGALVAFRVAARVAVVAGDPLVLADQVPRAVEEFVALCRQNGWVPCFYQTAPAMREAYRRAHFRVATFGEEAVVDLAQFSLDGRRRANLRREVARARRAGLTPTLLAWSDVDEQLRADLARTSTAWLSSHRSHREMGFSLGRFGETIDGDALLTVVRASSGEIAAFSTWLRLGHDGIGLDLIRRRPDASPGAVDMCIATTLEAARSRGLRVASLGLIPFRAESGHAVCGGRMARRARSMLFRRCVGGYRYRTLARFKDKFAPRWEPRDIAFPPGFAAPRALAGLIAVHVRKGA